MKFISYTNMPVSIITVQYIEIAIRTLIDVCITIIYSTKYDKRYTFILSACHIEFHYNSFTPAKDEESDRKFTKCSFSEKFPPMRLIFFAYMSLDSFIK